MTCYNSELPVGPPGPQGPIGPQGIQGPVGPVGPPNGGIIIFKATNSVASDVYASLDNLTITNLINNNDSIQIESVIRYINAASSTTMDGYKFQVNGVDIHEYTSTQFDNTNFKYLIHTSTITRVSATVLNIISEIKTTDSTGKLYPIISTPQQTFEFTSPAITNTASIPLAFLLKSDNNADNANKGKQVVLRITYIPKY